MTEQEWLKLKQYLDECGIEYQTRIACITGGISTFVVELPVVTVYSNTPQKLDNAYPEVTAAWNKLWNELKGTKTK